MTAPRGIRSAAGQLVLEWADGRRSEIAHARLRAACPCAQCRAARLRGHIDLAPADIRLLAVNAHGYGVQLVFSDGHDRGIYPWEYLGELGAL